MRLVRDVVLEGTAAVNIVDSLEAVTDEIKEKLKICLNSGYYKLAVKPDFSWDLQEKECPISMVDEYYDLKEEIPNDALCGGDLALQEQWAEQIDRLRYLERYNSLIEPYKQFAEDVHNYMGDYYDQWEEGY